MDKSMKDTLSLSAPCLQVGVNSQRISATLNTPKGPFNLYYSIQGATPSPNADAFVTAALLPAMVNNWSVASESPLSPRLLAALSTIQDIFHVWDDHYNHVHVDAPQKPPTVLQNPINGVGAFFSGGVDSFYTLLKHQKVVKNIIFVIGFDIRPDDHVLREKASLAIQQVADDLDLSLIEVETNVRQFSDQYTTWPMYHGAALASVALLLTPQISTVYIPASHTYADSFPWGSHPLVDPLWSTESLSIIHDGCEARRIDKIARIAESPVALKTLRVCWQNPGSTYNCGKCEKCLRTMVSLLVVGALDKCTTFDSTIDVGRIAHMRFGDDASTLSFLQENLDELERTGAHPELAEAIRKAMQPPNHIRRCTRDVLNGARNFIPIPYRRKIRRLIRYVQQRTMAVNTQPPTSSAGSPPNTRRSE